MLAAWLGAEAVPLARVRPQVLLVDGDMVIRQCLASPSSPSGFGTNTGLGGLGTSPTTVRALRMAVVECIHKEWAHRQADWLVVAFDSHLTKLPLGRTARNHAVPPVLSPVELGDDDLVPAGAASHLATRWQLQQAVTDKLRTDLWAPKRASAAARVVVLDAQPSSSRHVEQARALLAQHYGALVEATDSSDALYAVMFGRMLSEGHGHIVRLEWTYPAEPDSHRRRRPLRSEEAPATGLGEAVVKLCHWARHAAPAGATMALWSDHPEALVPAWLTPSVHVVYGSGGGAAALALPPPEARSASLLLLGLAAGNLAPDLAPCTFVVGPSLARLEADTAVAHVSAEDCLTVDLAGLTKVLWALAHHQLPSPPGSPLIPRGSPLLLARHVHQLRASGGQVADPPSLQTCLVQSRRAQWLLRYYLGVPTDDTRFGHGDWGWTVAESVPFQATPRWRQVVLEGVGQCGWRLVGHSMETLRLERIARRDDIAVPPEAVEELGRLFG